MLFISNVLQKSQPKHSKIRNRRFYYVILAPELKLTQNSPKNGSLNWNMMFFKGMASNEKKWFEGANLKIENFGHTSFCDTSYFCKQIAFCRPQPILDDKTIFVRRAFVSLCIAIISPFRTHPNITIGNKSVFHSFPLPCAKKCRLIYAQFWCTWPSS